MKPCTSIWTIQLAMELRSDTIGNEPTITVMHVSGELNAATCEQFLTGVVNEVSQDHVDIIIDGSELSFVSSPGLATVLRAYSRIKKHNGTLKFADLQSKVDELFQLVHFDALFPIYPTVGEAVNSY